MGGGGRGAHNFDDGGTTRRDRASEPEALQGGEQTGHNPWRDEVDISDQLGVSIEEARDMFEAIQGFTFGWDTVMRARQRGADVDEILEIHGTKAAIRDEFGGNVDAYMKELDKRVANADRFLELAPKWNGGELQRGYALTQADVDKFTSGNIVNLNFGNASWTTDPETSEDFANNNMTYKMPVKFIAHTTDKRNATSITNLSECPWESEVYGSQGEAFVCTKTQQIGDFVHGWFDVVDYKHKWKY